LQQQLQRLVGKRFMVDTPYPQLQHFPRYLKAMQLRLDKLRADPARDLAKRTELKPLDQRYWRLVAERKGIMDERPRIPLVARRVAGQFFCAGIAHASAGQRQTPGQGVGLVAALMPHRGTLYLSHGLRVTLSYSS